MFGWLETILGVIALAMGFASLHAYSNPGERLSSLRVAEAVVAGLMLAILVAQAAHRFFYKELFAFIYGIVAMGGAICALIVLLQHSLQPGTFFVVYFFAWAMAMAVKMFWLCCADFGPTARFQLDQHVLLDSKLKIWVVTIIFCLLSIIGFGIQITILTKTFEEG